MNILIIKHGSLGDLIVSFGAMKTLRVNYPNSNIYLLTQSNYKKTFKFEISPGSHNSLVWDKIIKIFRKNGFKVELKS